MTIPENILWPSLWIALSAIIIACLSIYWLAKSMSKRMKNRRIKEQ